MQLLHTSACFIDTDRRLRIRPVSRYFQAIEDPVPTANHGFSLATIPAPASVAVDLLTILRSSRLHTTPVTASTFVAHSRCAQTFQGRSQATQCLCNYSQEATQRRPGRRAARLYPHTFRDPLAEDGPFHSCNTHAAYIQALSSCSNDTAIFVKSTCTTTTARCRRAIGSLRASSVSSEAYFRIRTRRPHWCPRFPPRT